MFTLAQSQLRAVRIALSFLLTLAVPATLAARDLFVSPNGTAGNDGSIGRPLDLATAISGATPARPGDTIWMRGGVYRGAFTSNLTGTAAQPITLRQYPGERATVDGGAAPATGTFVVLGAYAIYWGFEITNTDFNRSGGISSRGTGLDIYGHHTKFINMVVHDAQTGVGFWTPASDSELYGLIIYDNGVDASDRGHGHSIYTQNDGGIKRIADNIAFNSFSFGIHAYTEGGRINNLQMDGNVLFNHGLLSAITGAKSNLLLGGGQVARNAIISNTFSYYSPGVGGRGADIGYQVACDSASVTSNIWVAATALNFNCSNTTFSGNTTYGYAGGLPSAYPYPANTYFSSRPTGTQIFVRRNQYEPKRANIIVFNWGRLPEVNVDLSGAGLAAGDEFEIRDVQDFFGPPVVSGVYTGAPVALYMLGSAVSVPVGNVALPRHTDQEFGVFVLMPKSTGTSTAPTASLAASPQTIVAGQSTTLSWSTSGASSATLSPGVGAVSTFGSMTVNPSATTTYTLTASGTNGATASSSATVTVTAAPPAGANSALFLRTDTTTKGSWKGTFGSEGYTLANDGTSLPSGIKVTLGQQQAWTWSGSTNDTRALIKAASIDRIAATWYSTATFSIDVDVKDGAAHEMALYSLDWDSQARVQSIQVVDYVTGALLDTRTVSGFSGGQYHVWRVSGHVVARITRSGPNSSALSGVFFAPAGGGTTPPANVAPTVTLTGPSAGAPFSAPATVALTATASDSDGTVSQVSFYAGTNPIGNGVWNGSAYAFNWTGVTAGTYRLTAKATDNSGDSTTSGYVDVTVGTAPTTPPVTPPAGATTAVFVKTDTTTRGSWQGTYGRDGFTLANEAASLPAYAQVSFTGQSAWTWMATTSDTRGLQRMTSTGRIAACWYSGGTFNIDVTLSDTATHQISLYALDWDSLGRIETVQVLDAATGAVLDTRTMSGFATGQYATWQVTGHVIFRITRTAGANATVSGVFFDGASAGSAAPSVTMAQPTGGPFTAPASIQLSATASQPGGTIGQVSFFEGTTLLGTSPNSSNPFTFQWTNVTAGSHTVFATATDGNSVTGSSQPVTIAVNAPGGSVGGATALFVKFDTTTKGSWKGVFGTQGYALAADTTQMPGYAQVALQGQSPWTWAASVTDVRGLQSANFPSRMAACWYTGTVLTIDVNLTDGVAHQVSLYNVDWDGLGRSQTIEVRDFATGNLLDSRSMSAFSDGQYASWRISGHVVIKVTRTAGSNAVLSGVFIDP